MQCSDRFVDKLGLWGGSCSRGLPMTLPTGLELACARKNVTVRSRSRGEKWDTKAERTVSAKEYRRRRGRMYRLGAHARSDRDARFSYGWRRLEFRPLQGPTAG